MSSKIDVVPANEASWKDVQTVSGTRGDARRSQCQHAGFRRRGVSRALARAAVAFARERGARALEGYPMLTKPGEDISWGELHVGSRSIFADAGFDEVTHPTPRRVVM